MAEDIKKVPDEIKDDELDLVAGGSYTTEQWASMSTEERRAARVESQKQQRAGLKCETYIQD